MYDPRQELHEFVGEARDQAIEKACQFFGAALEELEVAEFAPGAVYGLAGRSVIVAALRHRRPPRGGDRGRSRETREGRSSARESNRTREPRRVSSAPSVGTVDGSVSEVGEFVLGVVERMAVGSFTLSESRESEFVIVSVRGPAAAAIAEGDARAADALQLLANQAALRAAGEEQPERVVVDIEGESEKRESFLSNMAQRVAHRALDTGRAVALDPMSPKDRRIIHLALREQEQVATMSRGQGRYRQVIVVPEGAAEYEEARRQGEAASRKPE